MSYPDSYERPVKILLQGEETTATLHSWSVHEGDQVQAGDTLGYVQFPSTSELTSLSASHAGCVTTLTGTEGHLFHVGDVVAVCTVKKKYRKKYDTRPIVMAIELLQKKRRDIVASAAPASRSASDDSEETQMIEDLCDLIDQEIKEQRIVLLRMYKELKRQEAERFDPEFTPWRVTRDLVEEQCKYVPRLPLDSRLVMPPEASLTFTTQVGNVEEEHSFHAYFHARATSTYPYLTYKEQREGEPICDQYRVFLTPHYALVAVADGCNWGKAPAQAAAKSAKSFIDYLKRNRDLFLNSSRVSRLCLEGLAAAHDSIIAGPYQEGQRIGTTTLLGGLLGKVVLPGHEETPAEALDDWVFIFASIGDCKAFLWDSKNQRVEELTPDSRSGENFLDPSDCGGRIGPYVDGGPDLRNLEIFMSPCVTGDMIFVCSDGVHDNFDPQMHGMSPQDLGLEQATWEECTPSQANAAKSEWRTEEMKRIINSDDPCAHDMTSRFVDYCQKMNQPAQTFMQEHPGKRLPNDYARFPGKMDHTTMVTIRVGEIPSHMFQRSHASTLQADRDGPPPSMTPPKSPLRRTESESRTKSLALQVSDKSGGSKRSRDQKFTLQRRSGSQNLCLKNLPPMRSPSLIAQPSNSYPLNGQLEESPDVSIRRTRSTHDKHKRRRSRSHRSMERSSTLRGPSSRSHLPTRTVNELTRVINRQTRQLSVLMAQTDSHESFSDDALPATLEELMDAAEEMGLYLDAMTLNESCCDLKHHLYHLTRLVQKYIKYQGRKEKCLRVRDRFENQRGMIGIQLKALQHLEGT